MVFTRFGLMQVFCRRHMTTAAEPLQSATQLSSNLFYASIKHSNYPHIAQFETFCSQEDAVRKLWYG